MVYDPSYSIPVLGAGSHNGILPITKSPDKSRTSPFLSPDASKTPGYSAQDVRHNLDQSSQRTKEQEESNDKSPPSMRSLTCFYWANQGNCIWPDETCLYSHHHTGKIANAPVRVERGRPAVAGKNASKPNPCYKNWRPQRSPVNFSMNPMIQQQIEHIHAKANQQRPTYIKRGDTDQDNKMVGANGYGPAEPANYDPCFQLPESPTHCNRNTSKSVGFDDAAYSGGPGHGIALTSETSSHTLQYDNGPIHGMPDASPAYLPRAYYVDGPNGVKPEQFRISAKAARNASRPAQDMYLRSPALDYASYSFESQAHGIPAIPLVPNSGGYVIHKSAYDTDDWTGGLEHAKVVHELADILQELEVTMSIQIETIARAGQKLCRIAKSLKTKKGDRKEEKGAYEAHGCEIATPGRKMTGPGIIDPDSTYKKTAAGTYGTIPTNEVRICGVVEQLTGQMNYSKSNLREVRVRKERIRMALEKVGAESLLPDNWIQYYA